MKNSFLILGCGRVGRSLCLTLKKKGAKVYLWDRNFEKAKRFCQRYKIKLIKNLKEYRGNFLIISIKDDGLEKISFRISKEIKQKGIAIHTSGIYDENILLPLKKNGWEVGKCHPIFSFPPKEKEIPPNLTFGIQGNKNTIKKIKSFLKIINAKPLLIPKGMESIYHLSLSIGSNFSSYIFYISMKIFEENFKNKKALEHLFYQTIKNVLDFGKEGFTGPHIRKDLKTIKKHREVIKKNYPELLKIYNFLAGKIIKMKF